MEVYKQEDIYEKTVWCAFIDGYNSVRQLNEDEKKSIYIFAALHLLRVLSYHAKCREGNQGAVYFMTDYHLNIFFGAYKRLTNLAIEKSELRIL
jgi:Ser/Thr protein kinase RdoA (MazF antagonist)